MDLIPNEELQSKSFLNLTPMVDFLFLVIAIFAVLAVTRTSLFDAKIDLAAVADQKSKKEEPISSIHLSINAEGSYTWIAEFSEYAMKNSNMILEQLHKQKSLGLLPNNSSETTIFLHIDRQATWNSIVDLAYSLKKAGYLVHSVYEHLNHKQRSD